MIVNLQGWILGAMAVLFPVASYLLYLALINGRPHPTLISGPWDFVGLLAGLSGFWLIAGPATLTIFQYRWRPAFVQGEWSEYATGSMTFVWLLPWLFYVAVVLIGTAFMFWRRRAYTMIYNIEPAVLEGLLAVVCTRLGLEAVLVGNRLQIYQAAAVPNPATSATASHSHAVPVEEHIAENRMVTSARSFEPNRPIEGKLNLDPFPSVLHVTLHWRYAPGTLRQDVEGELVRQLAEIDTVDNPAANWLLTISSCLFSAIFLGLIGFVLLLMKR